MTNTLKLIEDIWAKGHSNILVNNAAGNFLAKTETLSAHAFAAVISIGAACTINMTLARLGKRWLAAKHPGIVLKIATAYADTGSAYVVPSAVAKAGVAALTPALRSSGETAASGSLAYRTRRHPHRRCILATAARACDGESAPRP